MSDRDALLRGVLHRGWGPPAWGWLEDHGTEADRARVELWQVGEEVARLRMQGTPAIYHPEESDAPEKLDCHRRREEELIVKWWSAWTLDPWDGDAVFSLDGMRVDCGDGWAQYFRRGLLHVEAPLATLRAGLPRMGLELAFVGSCRATDREPSWHRWYGRVNADDCADADDLPVQVWNRLKGGSRFDDDDETYMRYEGRSDSAALADLEQADLGGWVLAEARAAVLRQPVTA